MTTTDGRIRLHRRSAYGAQFDTSRTTMWVIASQARRTRQKRLHEIVFFDRKTISTKITEKNERMRQKAKWSRLLFFIFRFHAFGLGLAIHHVSHETMHPLMRAFPCVAERGIYYSQPLLLVIFRLNSFCRFLLRLQYISISAKLHPESLSCRSPASFVDWNFDWWWWVIRMHMQQQQQQQREQQ